MPPTKVCRVCQLPKPYDQLIKHKDCIVGVDTLCKTCKSAESKRWRNETMEQRKQYSRAWYLENREKVKARVTQYYQAHKKEKEQYDTKYYAKNIDRISARSAQYKRQHRELVKVSETHRRNRKCNLPFSFTEQDWINALEYFNHCCAVCGRPQGLWHTLAMDHWIPLSDPSPDNPGTVPRNIVPLCHGKGGCNNSKHDLNPLQWLTKKYGKHKASKISAKIQAYFDLQK